jgi:hypothetical protein
VSYLPVLSDFNEKNCEWNVFVYHIVRGINVKLINIPTQGKGIPSTAYAVVQDKRATWVAGAVYTKQKLCIQNIKGLYEVYCQKSQYP